MNIMEKKMEAIIYGLGLRGILEGLGQITWNL